MQTGDRSTATFTQTIQQGLTAPEILQLLDRLEEILSNAPDDLDREAHEELGQAISEGRRALENPKAGRFALRGVAGTLMNFTQTVAAIPGAADTMVQLAQALEIIAR